MSNNIDMKALLEAGAHFGHKTSRWHPKMAPFIHSKRGDAHIINLEKTVEGLEKALNLNIDLIILDYMLPYKNGPEVLKLLRQKKQTPVIMLTAREGEEDRYEGWEAGADQYVGKPCPPKELILRIKNLLQRSKQQTKATVNSGNIIKVGDLTIDTEKIEVRKGSTALNLSALEYELLMFLITHPDKVHTREQLINEVWKYDAITGSERQVDVTIRRLREKIESNPDDPVMILTRRGAGYYFNIE